MADSPLKILAVDDNSDALFVLEEALVRRGFVVVTAGSGVEALKRASEERPDIVLLDINMPGMDGYEVTRRLKADPATASISAVVRWAMPRDAELVCSFMVFSVVNG